MISSSKSQQCLYSAAFQRYFHNFLKLFLCFTNCPPSTLVNSRQSPGCFHRPPAFVLVKMSRVLHRGMFFCKRGLFKKLAHLLYYFLCNVFYHYFSLSLMDFGPSVVRQGSPAAFRMHESLVTGCRGYSSQTVGLNICL